jgi:hypothetical protein
MADTPLNANFCSARRLLFVYNTPPSRYNPTSPYVDTSYNQYDLDMRRKVEILKYNSSINNGTITKTKKWGQIINTNIRPTIAAVSSVDCGSDDLIPTLTSACDVPGPITVLRNIPAVPLYNYKKNQDAYSRLDTLQSTDAYQINGIIPNLLYVVGARNFLFRLKILDNINYDITTFELYVPITIQINYHLSNVAVSGSIVTSIDLPDLIVTYAYQDIILKKKYGVNMFKSGDVPSETNNINPANNNSIALPIGETSILIHYYLLISNIELSTLSGLVYSLYLNFATSLYTSKSQTNIKDSDIYVYLNHVDNSVKMKIDTMVPPFPANISLT